MRPPRDRSNDLGTILAAIHAVPPDTLPPLDVLGPAKTLTNLPRELDTGGAPNAIFHWLGVG